MKCLSKITILLLMTGCGSESSDNEGKGPSLDATTKEYINCNAQVSKIEAPETSFDSCFEVNISDSSEDMISAFKDMCPLEYRGKGQCPRSNVAGTCLHTYDLGDAVQVYYPANSSEIAKSSCLEDGGKWSPK